MTTRPPLRREGRARSILFVLFAGAAFSIASPLARWARPLDPLVLALGRLVVAAVALSLPDLPGLARSWRPLTRRQRGQVLLAGAILAAHFACFLWGLDHTSLPAAVSLVSLEPMSVVLLAWAILRVAPRGAELVGVVVATGGAVLVARGAGAGGHRLSGDAAVLAAVALYGLYLTVARSLKDALPARSYAALVYAGAAAVMVVLVFASRSLLGADAPPAWTGAPGLVAILGLGLIPTVLGHTAVQTASRSLPPGIVALVSPMETLGGILVSAVWLSEAPSPRELGGAAVILVGTAVALGGAALQPSVAPSSSSPS